MRNDEVYLRHIAESIALVEWYVTDADRSLSEGLFFRDLRTQDAVLRRLETLADAASHLSDVLKARHPKVSWRQIGDFRNVLAHGYTDIRLDQVWQVIISDLPALKEVIAAEVDRLDS